jgi:TldD protein
MRLSRRFFLETGAGAAALALADDLFGFAASADIKGPSLAPGRDLTRLAETAIDAARRAGATYADIRIARYRDQSVAVRSVPDLATGKLNHVPSVRDSQSFGFGVRVIAKGTWGFAASARVTPDELVRVAREAVAVAHANAALSREPVRLAPVSRHVDRYTTPFKTSPFDVPIPDKLAMLEKANLEAKSVAKVFSASSSVGAHAEDKFFASTDGSRIQQYVLQVYGALTATTRDLETRLSRSRTYPFGFVTAGWEAIERADLAANARRIGEEAVEHLSAPPVTPGKKDLVLLPSHLGLTIHESVGHPTELDRALGYEANFAGTSFVTTDKLGKLRYGSELMNIVGDRTTPEAMSTVGYDDEGVPAVAFDIVKNGTFVGYQTIREQAHLVGEKESKACCYADSFASVPFQRMPNVWLKPGEKTMSLDDLIGGVEDGILIDGRGSYSIDHQRYNFQFGGDAFWEIKGGKKGKMLSRVAYQARTPDFWAALDGIADKRFWFNFGLNSDGKGEPGQTNAMSHGCAPSRFRNIDVLLTD